MITEETRCILENQQEIMTALSLVLRHLKPDLVGLGGELDRQRDDLFQRYKATRTILTNSPSQKQDQQ